MDFSIDMMSEFLEKLIALDKNCKSVVNDSENSNANNNMEKDKSIKSYLGDISQNASDFFTQANIIYSDGKDSLSEILDKNIVNKRKDIERLDSCFNALAVVRGAKKYIEEKKEISSVRKPSSFSSPFTLEELLNDSSMFTNDVINFENKIALGSRRNLETALGQMFAKSEFAEQLLKEEIETLSSALLLDTEKTHNSYKTINSEVAKKIKRQWDFFLKENENKRISFISEKANIKSNALENKDKIEKDCSTKLESFCNDFIKEFSPVEILNTYLSTYSNEPIYSQYECKKELPEYVYISKLEYDLEPFELCDYVKDLLNKFYFFMYRENELVIPYCTKFNSKLNLLFNYNFEGRQTVVKDACDLGMRLFTMLPPGKVNFTLIDPVTLGESFAIFTRLVDVDDRTSEIINGKIWSTSGDIENKLRIMTNHISTVTQRCLQGKFDNIFEYNKIAEDNAEAYQVIMLMDFPAGLNDASLKLLEQISTSGPKCGVFTFIFKSNEQYEKFPERSLTLVTNVEENFNKFTYSKNASQIFCNGGLVHDKSILWKNISFVKESFADDVIATLKKGIKTADKVVIGIEKVNDAESVNTTKDGIRIPIGIHGANEIQYLTLGVGGSHHALIAGVAGSGKSSLLHTIILRTLMQYSPEELVIYLVDFKRGVEFKIYADYILPSFRVVAIESEREFGYNILTAIEREQKIRADLFKKKRVDKIEEYRELGEKMPRVLVIMDEFHELFSNSNDEYSKKSSIIIERIVRQGRAFGVHMILASQSYSNITGIDKAVFDQMAVRIALKCSKTDANLLLENGSAEIDQISIDDPGRAVYNSEAGNQEYNSHFRVAYIDPSKHKEMLQNVSDATKKYADPKKPTRILLSNIEDNYYSIFNQFKNYNTTNYDKFERLYIGEPLSVNNGMALDFARSEFSNVLMIGNDSDKARSMFAFSLLSLCINYYIKNGAAPKKPIICLFNCKPLVDDYFKDIPKIIAEKLPQYIEYIDRTDDKKIQEYVSRIHGEYIEKKSGSEENYMFVFGYQRAEELKSENKVTQREDINNIFNLTPVFESEENPSMKDMFRNVLKNGAINGLHVVLWQDSFSALYQDDKDIVSYFTMKIAFDMTDEEYSRFVNVNDTSMINENNAIYYNKAKDNQTFRPYQSPDETWIAGICEKLV